MNKLLAVFLIALFTNGAFGQQAEKKNNTGNLDDRFGYDGGWMGPSWFPNNWSKFPGQNQIPGQNQFFGQNQFLIQQLLTTTPSTVGSTTTSPEIQQCINNCLKTTEYNPVCGTNKQTYWNASFLRCAQLCGVNVTLLRTSRCPKPAAQ